MEIVPVVDGAVPAEDRPGGVGVTRFVLLLALLIGGSTDSLIIHLSNGVLVSTVFLLVSPLTAVTTVALKLRAALVFSSVLSFAFCPFLSCLCRVCLSCSCHRTQRRFPLVLLPLTLNGLAATTVSPLSNFPLFVS